MTIVTPRRMTLKEFLTYDNGSDARYELVDGVLVEMGAESRSNLKIAVFLLECFLRLVDRQRIGIKEKIEVSSRFVTARDPDLMIHSIESMFTRWTSAMTRAKPTRCSRFITVNCYVSITVSIDRWLKFRIDLI